MNQRVDIEKYLEEFRSSMARMEGTVAELTEDNARLNRRVEAQNVGIRSLKSENASLRDRLSKYEDPEPPKNSNNSSVPPSKGKMGDKIKRCISSLRENREETRRTAGTRGQYKMKLDAPNVTEMHQPNFCRECGRDLSDIEVYMEFEEECVGLKVIPQTIGHSYISKKCTCGCCNKLDVPKRENPVYFSDDVSALVVYLNVVMCMPYNRIKSFLSDVIHIDLSEGSIRNFIEAAGKKADPICEKISVELVKSSVGGADESGVYVSGKLKWVRILQNPLLTLTWIAKGRGAKEMTGKFSDNALENMVLTTDRHTAYFTIKVKGHQICIAHLLRNINYLNELDNGQDWSSRLQELLRKAVHWRNENPGVQTTSKTWIESLDKLLNENLDKFKKPFRQLRNSLRKLKDHIFTFLENPQVPSHNDDSEGGIRILKVKQKRSGSFRSDRGA